jgi:hypothetical protein
MFPPIPPIQPATSTRYGPGSLPMPNLYVSEHTHKQLKEARAEYKRLDADWTLLKIRFASAGYPFSSHQDEMDRLEGLPTTGWDIDACALHYDLHAVNPRKHYPREYGGYRG